MTNKLIETTVALKELTDLVPAASAKAVKPVKLSKEKIEAAILLLQKIENNNGYLGIARTAGLYKEDVLAIHAEMKKRISILSIKEDILPEEVEPKEDIKTEVVK